MHTGICYSLSTTAIKLVPSAALPRIRQYAPFYSEHEEAPSVQEALIRRQVEAYAADPSGGASKGQSSIQIRRDWKAKEKQLQVTPHLTFVA